MALSTLENTTPSRENVPCRRKQPRTPVRNIKRPTGTIFTRLPEGASVKKQKQHLCQHFRQQTLPATRRRREVDKTCKSTRLNVLPFFRRRVFRRRVLHFAVLCFATSPAKFLGSRLDLDLQREFQVQNQIKIGSRSAPG